jgi:hypothetical protein
MTARRGKTPPELLAPGAISTLSFPGSMQLSHRIAFDIDQGWWNMDAFKPSKEKKEEVP